MPTTDELDEDKESKASVGFLAFFLLMIILGLGWLIALRLDRMDERIQKLEHALPAKPQ